MVLVSCGKRTQKGHRMSWKTNFSVLCAPWYTRFNKCIHLCICSVQLTENYSIHVIMLPSHGSRRYVACAEVSALIWDEDIVREKVLTALFFILCLFI